MMRRAVEIRLIRLLVLLGVGLPGCAGTWMRPKEQHTSLEELVDDEDAHFISTFTHPTGANYVKVEAISLCTGLDGTGGDPPPTAQRAALLDEMKRRQIPQPSQYLSQSDNALVLVLGLLPPGIQEGDRFDIEVRTPTRTEATSLAGGWVLPARMSEMAVLGDSLHTGHELAVCEGPVLVDGVATDNAGENTMTRGRILGGGVALKSRSMGLMIDRKHQSVRLATAIAKSVNDRFYSYRDGQRKGVATAKTDEYVELAMHPRYKENVGRYIKVIRNVTVNESPTELQERLIRLQTQLLDPLTTAKAAVRLEAVGSDQAVEILEEGLKSDDIEVRFYSAEALAYLDKTVAVEALAEAARTEPALRINSLAALGAMEDIVAYDALRSLLDATSAETRYGAFRALWSMNSNDPLVRGERLSDRFSYHVLDVGGPPMVHVTRSYRPEVVVFGANQRLQTPLVLDAGKNILINGMYGDEIIVTRIASGEEAQKRVIKPTVDALVRTIVELGGAYPDVVQALRQAKRDGALTSRFRVDALPEPGRELHPGDEELPPDEAGAAPYKVATPMPDLFGKK